MKQRRAAYFDGGNADFDITQFIAAADKMLYRAKNGGRNRVEVTLLKQP